jgi:hypothetical protein
MPSIVSVSGVIQALLTQPLRGQKVSYAFGCLETFGWKYRKKKGMMQKYETKEV